MTKKKPEFINDEMYHIYNRGVEKRNIFIDKQDYLRFIHCLYEFNNSDSVINLSRDLMSEVQPHSLRPIRNLLVEVVIFTLMPNHFHLILRQKQENGIVKFMQKIGTGYTMYFNQKNDRVGGLFQGRFKAVHIDNEAYLDWLPLYIHSNPVKDNESSLLEKIERLDKYRWSSHADYLGVKNFPSVTSRDWLLDYLGGFEGYKNKMKDWLQIEREVDKGLAVDE